MPATSFQRAKESMKASLSKKWLYTFLLISLNSKADEFIFKINLYEYILHSFGNQRRFFCEILFLEIWGVFLTARE